LAADLFFRSQPADARTCLQVVENQRENGRVRQRVIATGGRPDRLPAAGELAALLLGARFSETLTGFTQSLHR